MVQTSFTVGSAAALAADLQSVSAGGANAGTGQAYTFTLAASFVLNAGLPVINLQSGSSLTIIGQGDTINGAGTYSGLFLQAGSLVLQHVTIQAMLASGGPGRARQGIRAPAEAAPDWAAACSLRRARRPR